MIKELLDKLLHLRIVQIIIILLVRTSYNFSVLFFMEEHNLVLILFQNCSDGV